MRFSRNAVAGFLLMLSGLAAGQQARASCTVNAPYQGQVPLQTTALSAGAEFPTGSVIMRQRVIGLRDIVGSCNGNVSVFANFNLTGGTLYPGQTNVYQTGIAGLGVRFRQVYENRLFPFTSSRRYSGQITFNPAAYLSFDMELVKLGTMTAGTVSTALFPQIVVNVTDNTYTGLVALHTITGTAVIQEASCTTPDFTWDLGRTNTTVLKSKGDASAWVDTPVTLTGCSVFRGNNSDGGYTQYSITGTSSGTIMQPSAVAANVVTMTLSPNTSVIDSANGIVGLDSASSAYGYGIQLASKQSGNYVPQNMTGSLVVTPVAGDSSGTVSFPLGARITRTSDSVRSGSISASLVYTINYQ